MSIPVIPPIIGLSIFGLLIALLVSREVARALGRTESRRWRVSSNWIIGFLLVSYGSVLLARFLNLLQ